jgi:hypothetical protein
MKKSDMKVGQSVYIASYMDGPEPEGKATVLVREYQVMKLLPSIFVLHGKHSRFKARWDTSRDLLASLWPTQSDALDYLEEKITSEIVQARLSVERFEKQKHAELYVIREWRRDRRI